MQPVKDKLQWVLRVEGMIMLILSIVAFSYFDTSWTMFITLFLIPDIALIAYFFGKKVGAVFYNMTHSLTGPMILMAIGFLIEGELTIAISFIWIAHIGFDRALGYGLKYSSGFRDTHLGVVGQYK